MAERILVLDPGQNVGWCRADLHVGGEITDLVHGITPLKDMALAVDERIDYYDTVLYETWKLFAHMARKLIGSSMPSSQFIGMVRLSAWTHPGVRLVSQEPSVMKTGIKVAPALIQERLATLPKAHDESHDGSALAHLSYYHWKNYIGVSHEQTGTAQRGDQAGTGR